VLVSKAVAPTVTIIGNILVVIFTSIAMSVCIDVGKLEPIAEDDLAGIKSAYYIAHCAGKSNNVHHFDANMNAYCNECNYDKDSAETQKNRNNNTFYRLIPSKIHSCSSALNGENPQWLEVSAYEAAQPNKLILVSLYFCSCFS
jgi:hypothetical protein